jgi:hypothetical protein
VAIAVNGFLASPAEAARPDQLGIASTGYLHNMNGAALARELDGYRSAGARWIRFDLNWAVVQHRGPRSYNWAPFDRVVRGARARGLNVLGVIGYKPRWVHPRGGDPLRPPRNAAPFGRFAAAVARRYGRLGVHHWEIWNEPNMAVSWRPRPSPAGYTRLLRAAYGGIKRADPAAVVITGGLSPSAGEGANVRPIRFLQRMYAAGARRFFDAVGHHASTFPALPPAAKPWSAWFQMFGTRPSLRSVMVARGDARKKIWITEYSAPTGSGRAVSEARQAQTVTTAYRLVGSYSWAGPLFWFTFRDRMTSGDWTDFCGLVREDYSPKPALTAYQLAATTGL